MSGDGTYVEYVAAGQGPPVKITHPPLTHNPHDPTQYYRGDDGKWYYTPDGDPHPEFGQPQVGKTPPAGHPTDPLHRSEEPNASWKHEADKGYHITPKDLRTLANKLEGDLNGLQTVLDRVQNGGKLTSAAVGEWKSGQDFLQISDTAYSAFTNYYRAIVTTYGNVIKQLRTTANNGERGEDDTYQAVTAHRDSPGDNKDMS